MRSRYAAYVLGDDAYVLATWAPETRPRDLFAPGEVEVLAIARTPQGALRMRERSRFRREPDGRWVYVDGDQLDP